MIIRKLKSTDIDALNLLLRSEGVKLSAVGKNYSLTWVAEMHDDIVGAYTLTLKEGAIFLQHLVVTRAAKSSLSRTAYRLIRHLEEIFRGNGVKRFIIDLAESRQTVCRLVERYFNMRIKKIKKITKLKDVKVYYFVEV